jgi:hypothetical protein
MLILIIAVCVFRKTCSVHQTIINSEYKLFTLGKTVNILIINNLILLAFKVLCILLKLAQCSCRTYFNHLFTSCL